MANNVFVIDDGTREVTFTNAFGEEICKVRIRSDYSILDRYETMLDNFSKVIEPIKDINIKTDGSAIDEESWATVKKIEQDIIEQLNVLFDTKDAANFFKNRSAFSTVNGHFYVESVLKALGDAIGEGMKEETELTKERIKKYTKDINKK